MTILLLILYNIVRQRPHCRWASVGQCSCSSISKTLRVLWYRLRTYLAACLCTISIIRNFFEEKTCQILLSGQPHKLQILCSSVSVKLLTRAKLRFLREQPDFFFFLWGTLHKSMIVNLVTERPATYLRRRNNVFDISGRSVAVQFWT